MIFTSLKENVNITVIFDLIGEMNKIQKGYAFIFFHLVKGLQFLMLNELVQEFMPDQTMRSPEETVIRQHIRSDVWELLETLDPRERQVLLLRYGFTDHQPKSLEEIGKVFHVSKEWIRKIEKKALNKLRDQETRLNLSHYLNLVS